jgi:hypothetical protein
MRVFVSFLILFALLTSSASAQEYVRFRLPDGRRLTVAGEIFQGFNLGEYTELLRMDEDLRNLTAVHVTDLARIEELTTATAEWRSAVDACNSSLEISQIERERLLRQLEEENRRRHEAENAPNLSWIPWTLAGGFAISTAVLALIVGLQ